MDRDTLESGNSKRKKHQGYRRQDLQDTLISKNYQFQIRQSSSIKPSRKRPPSGKYQDRNGPGMNKYGLRGPCLFEFNRDKVNLYNLKQKENPLPVRGPTNRLDIQQFQNQMAELNLPGLDFAELTRQANYNKEKVLRGHPNSSSLKEMPSNGKVSRSGAGRSVKRNRTSVHSGQRGTSQNSHPKKGLSRMNSQASSRKNKVAVTESKETSHLRRRPSSRSKTLVNRIDSSAQNSRHISGSKIESSGSIAFGNTQSRFRDQSSRGSVVGGTSKPSTSKGYVQEKQNAKTNIKALVDRKEFVNNSKLFSNNMTDTSSTETVSIDSDIEDEDDIERYLDDIRNRKDMMGKSPEFIERRIKVKREKLADLNKPSKWAQDELNAPKEGETKGQRKRRLRKLYESKVQLITFRKSKYPNRPITFFVGYPDKVVALYLEQGNPQQILEGVYLNYVDMKDNELPEDEFIGVTLRRPKNDELIKLSLKNFRKRYSIPISKVGKVYRSIRDLMKNAGFIISKSQKYNFCWGFSKHRDQVKLLEKYQRFAHFQGCWQIGRKDFLWKNINKMSRKHPDVFDFLPKTYCFKNDYQNFLLNKKKCPYWIIKPVDSARGLGIKVVSCDDKIKYDKNILASQYIKHPHLINGHKYDLRVYVLITCADPLRVFVYKEGLVRFASNVYKLNKETISNQYSHLTNFSINKHNSEYRQNSDKFGGSSVKGNRSMKWMFADLERYFVENEPEVSFSEIFNDVCDVVAKTFIGVDEVFVEPFNRKPEHRNNSFEVFGVDILLDSKLKCWLIECNVGPSMNQDSKLDKIVKLPMQADLFNLLGVRPYKRKKKKNGYENTGLNYKDGQKKEKMFTSVALLKMMTKSNYKTILRPEDYVILFETAEEYHRRGNFVRAFPTIERIDDYQDIFEIERNNNILVWKWMQLKEEGFDILEDVLKMSKKHFKKSSKQIKE